MPAVPAIVAIPAWNEAERIAACLTALANQIRPPTGAVLLANNCTDGTEAIARGVAASFRIEIVSLALPPECADAGTARRLAMQLAATLAGPRGVVLTTDADAVVPADWVALNLEALASGADIVCGQAVIDPHEARAIAAHLHADDALECEYADLLDALADATCPDPADPRPRHTEASGASLAVTVDALRRAGGVPALPMGEDRALVAALARIDARIRHDPGIRVTVSGRLEGRAPGGMADTMRRRMIRQDEFTDAVLEPAVDALRRADFRRRVRAAWANRGTEPDLAADLLLEQATLDRLLDTPFRGTAWANIEQASRLMHRRRVRFTELPRQIAHARDLLTSLSPAVAS